MTHRQPKRPLALRVIAAGCVVLWLVGVSACSLDSLFCCDSHPDTAVAHAGQEDSCKSKISGTEDAREANALHSDTAGIHHSDDAEAHSHGSDKHDGKECSCCSNLKAVVQIAKPVVFAKPAFHPIPFLGVLLETRAASLALSEIPPNRQAKPRDWVFTPEVCLDPAHRSHAPPSFI